MDAKKSGARDTHQSDPGKVDMIYHKLLLSITFIAFFLAQANAQPGDPLDPNQLGESMSMPMSQELIQEARNAGVITESNPLSESDSKQLSLSVAPQPEAGADNSLNNVNVNVTGAWSFDLKGKALEQMKLYLIQNKDVVIGQGVINRENETENATASGSISGEKMSLTVIPVGVSNLYKLNLSLSSMDGGPIMPTWPMVAAGPARSHTRFPRIFSSLYLRSPKMDLVHMRPRTRQLLRLSNFRALWG